jgi:hypothetical protein
MVITSPISVSNVIRPLLLYYFVYAMSLTYLIMVSCVK